METSMDLLCSRVSSLSSLSFVLVVWAGVAFPAAGVAQAPSSSGYDASTSGVVSRVGHGGPTISLGAVFPIFGTESFCASSTFGAVQIGYEAPVSGSIDGQVEAFYAPSGAYPWPWVTLNETGGGGAQAPSSYDHEGGFQLAVNLLIPVIGDDSYSRLQVKALAGFGARRLGAAQYSQGGAGQIERYGVDTQLSPLLNAGVVADIGLTDRVGARLQVRGTALFSGELQLRGATASQDRLLSGETQVFGQAIVGLTVKLGR